ncbi:hypothetical protein [Burkholderia sp. IMCC1007]|uniref:hypothetical protein n=1 Tax=Burkholderia sp. IMCC1007 TaxID=3004104 RepID=UPI0022B5C332|nr:hypothetical protein [Burkholderia sp. IMCC1007]
MMDFALLSAFNFANGRRSNRNARDRARLSGFPHRRGMLADASRAGSPLAGRGG